ncbi:MAG: hypothetical protein KF760_18850 [Candidatus Eremiobacteraeota bacterium]|nr:hypothetical protein [Candidatus Eremiobacteraeota bacterium]MCW5868458.1 hypothetical protein [Candidatus Eremiobacteraeota bacterium]
MHVQAPGLHCRFLTAEDSPDPERREGRCPRQGEYSLCRFSDAYMHSLYAGARSELRFKARGVVLLTSLIRQLQPLDAATGVYLCGSFGPYSPRAQSAGLSAAPGGRAAAIERALPPKDYFIATPALKAAQLSIDFQVHGPVMAVFSPEHGFAQACRLARADLADEVVPAALVAGLFTLEEAGEFSRYLSGSRQLVEAVWVQYVTHSEQIVACQGPSGRFGPLTPNIERSPVHE